MFVRALSSNRKNPISTINRNIPIAISSLFFLLIPRIIEIPAPIKIIGNMIPILYCLVDNLVEVKSAKWHTTSAHMRYFGLVQYSTECFTRPKYGWSDEV